MQSGKSPVRERKKQATRQALRQATLELGLRHGLDEVHIDDIAAHAGVSPRTFFNYFDTKEDAAVIDAPEFTDAELDELAGGTGDSGDAVVADLVQLFGRSLEGDREPGQEIERYIRLHRENPQLVSRQLMRFARLEAALSHALLRRLPALTPTQADVLAGCCMAASRTALQRWSTDGSDRGVHAHLRDCLAVLGPAFDAVS